jgi:hypothetical protein
MWLSWSMSKASLLLKVFSCISGNLLYDPESEIVFALAIGPKGPAERNSRQVRL